MYEHIQYRCMGHNVVHRTRLYYSVLRTAALDSILRFVCTHEFVGRKQKEKKIYVVKLSTETHMLRTLGR